MKRGLFTLIILSLIGLRISSVSAQVQEATKESKLSGLRMFVDVTTMKEHMETLKMTKLQMKKEPKATHHLSVNLEDEYTGEKIKEAEISVSCISSNGKEVYSGTLGYMPGMKHFGGNITLNGTGKYYIKIVAYLKESAAKYSVAIPFKVETVAMKVTDPVCGMEIEAKGDITAQYKGKTYHLCSSGCKNRFEKEPEKYIKKQ